MKRRLVRRLAWVGVALCLVALALGVTERLLWRPGVTEANVRRIQPGMTLPEVEAVLGGPAGSTLHYHRPGEEGAAPLSARYWVTPAGVACALFDENDRVEVASFDPEELPGTHPGPLDRLRALFGW